MNRMCTVFCLLLGLAIATIALPSAADSGKKFLQQMAIPPGQATAPFTITATVTNEGNSTISSFQLTVGGMSVVGVTQPSSGKATFTPASVSVKNMGPLKSGQSITVTIAVNSCGDGQWSGVAWTGSQLNGQTFNLDPASVLATSISCGDFAAGANDVPIPDSLHPGCVTVSRDYYDKDGTVPVTVPIFVTNTVFTDNQLNFRWPDFQGQVQDPLAAFEYTVCAPGPLPEVSNTQVAWLDTLGHPASEGGAPAYIPAPNCIDPDQLPAPYGTLLTNLDASYTGTISIDTTTPSGAHGTISYPAGTAPSSPASPGTPFDVIIGTERITLQFVCLDNEGDPTDADDCIETAEGEGKALQIVQRGVAGTTAAPHALVPHPPLVMSTPLPILPAGTPAPYTAGNQALMCVADRFNEEGGGHATTIIDIGGDGHIGGP